MEPKLVSPLKDSPDLPVPEQPEQQPMPDPTATPALPDTSLAAPVLNQVPRKSHKKLIIIVVLLAVLLAAAAGFLIYYQKHHTSTSSKTTAATQAGDQFFSSPQKISKDLGFIKDPETYFGQTCTGDNGTDCSPTTTAADIEYFKIGETAKKQSIVVAYDNQATEGAFNYLAIENQPNHYEILAYQSGLGFAIPGNSSYSAQGASEFRQALANNVTLDTSTQISELDFGSSLTINKMSIKLPSTDYYPGYFLPLGLKDLRDAYESGNYSDGVVPAITKIGSSGGKVFYEVTLQDQPNYKVEEIDATVGGVYGSSYTPNDPLITTGTKNLDATWTSGNQTAAQYSSAAQGCGSPNGYVVAKNLDVNQLQVVGTGPNGQQLYQLPSDSPLFNELYQTDYSAGANLEDATLENLTAQQFQDMHAVLLAQNGLGELGVYERSDLFVRGGCGKPVIYLYPTKTMNVSVKVGADIRSSDPAYIGGWNVVAHPSGQITWHGQNFDSLYWEGYGNGQYPEITTGTVVAQAQLAETLKNQLSQQGLNSKESADFMAFWLPKMPTTPYVRLSWLNTAQLNELAPLQISPRPATLIRIFLDYQGLNQPVNLPPQALGSVPRKGFTVVEWGGLLHTPLPSKTQ